MVVVAAVVVVAPSLLVESGEDVHTTEYLKYENCVVSIVDSCYPKTLIHAFLSIPFFV